MNLNKFFSELERRKVYRVSIAYGIAAWVLAQIASLVSDSFEAEPWVMKMINNGIPSFYEYQGKAKTTAYDPGKEKYQAIHSGCRALLL